MRSLESRRFNLEQTIAEATEAIEQRQRVLRQAELNLAQVNEQQPTAAHRASQERFVEERRRMAVDIDPEALRAELVAIEEELSRERAALARHDELDRECRERGWR